MKRITVLLIVVFLGCSTSKKEKIEVSLIKISNVTLNKGKLWKANRETTEGIKKMQKKLTFFNRNSNVKKYSKLKEQLETEFTEIFSKCTMKGEAHEQLHNYLKPLISYFEDLESNDINVRKESFKKLEIHLLGYDNYFK